MELLKTTPQLKHGILIALFAFLVQVLFLVYLKVFYAAVSSPMKEFEMFFGDDN